MQEGKYLFLGIFPDFLNVLLAGMETSLSPMPPPIRLLLADDHQMFLDGLSELISCFCGVELVGTAVNGEEVLQQLGKHPCDLVVMDIHMPVLDGLATSRLIRKQHPHTRVLILTMNSEFSLVKQLLDAGALGYILKTTGREELERAIRRVSAGLTYFSESVARELARQHAYGSPLSGKTNGQETQPAIPAMVLTEREREIVSLVAREYSSTEIADLLFIAPSTVDTHRRNIIQKLGVKNVAGLTSYAFRHGLVD
jgi:DNA-binding NarL/FixJ family response regulator